MSDRAAGSKGKGEKKENKQKLPQRHRQTRKGKANLHGAVACVVCARSIVPTQIPS
jgi:hypothetical protein